MSAASVSVKQHFSVLESAKLRCALPRICFESALCGSWRSVKGGGAYPVSDACPLLWLFFHKCLGCWQSWLKLPIHSCLWLLFLVVQYNCLGSMWQITALIKQGWKDSAFSVVQWAGNTWTGFTRKDVVAQQPKQSQCCCGPALSELFQGDDLVALTCFSRARILWISSLPQEMGQHCSCTTLHQV